MRLQFLKIIGPGIVLAIVVMIAAKALAVLLPTLGVALLALVLGVLIRQLLGRLRIFESGVTWTEKYVLEAAIVFIGFGFQLTQLARVGLGTIGFVCASVPLVMGIALVLQRVFKDKGNLFLLLGAGSAICGSAAIGATAPLLGAKEEETGISLTVINLLGLIGMLLLPFIASVLQMSASDTAIFLGGILQSMGQVVGSSYSVNSEIGQIATIVKMSRIVVLVPFLFIVFFMYGKKSENKKVAFPMFILLFAATATVSQTSLLTSDVLKVLAQLGEYLLNIGMAAIGLKINIRSLLGVSRRALYAGVLIFLFQIALYFSYVVLF